MLVGAGSAGSSIDAANILKPALARGELQCIGATTLDEYRKHIESDAALERRFQRSWSTNPRLRRPSRSSVDKYAYEQLHRRRLATRRCKLPRSFPRAMSRSASFGQAIDVKDEAASRGRCTSRPCRSAS